jgi:hypothetical protein
MCIILFLARFTKVASNTAIGMYLLEAYEVLGMFAVVFTLFRFTYQMSHTG